MVRRSDYRKCIYEADTPACFRALWTKEEKARIAKAVRAEWKE